MSIMLDLISILVASLKSLMQQHQHAALRSRHGKLFITGYRLLSSLRGQVALSQLVTRPYLFVLLVQMSACWSEAELLNRLVQLISYQYLKQVQEQRAYTGGVRVHLLVMYEIMLLFNKIVILQPCLPQVTERKNSFAKVSASKEGHR